MPTAIDINAAFGALAGFRRPPRNIFADVTASGTTTGP